MQQFSSQKKLICDIGIIASLIVAGIVTYYCLNNGIHDIFLSLYFIPVILIIYSHPKFGIYGTILIGWLYFALVCLWETPDSRLFTIATIRFYIFVSVGILIAAYSREQQKSEENYRSVYYHSQACTFSINKKTREVTDANRKFARMLNYQCKDLIKKNLSDIITNTVEREAFFRKLNDSSRISDSEVRMSTSDGQERWALVSASKTDNDEIICTAVDITDLKTSQHALMLANRKLNLLSGITRHDILNKISGARGYYEVMRMKFPDPALAEYITRLDDTTKEVQSLIDGTQIYQDIGTQEPQWLEPEKIIRLVHVPDTVLLTEDTAGFEVFADPMLEKVFNNLLDNSIRHGEHVSRITLTARKSDEGLIIIWEDNGTGIKNEDKEKIFERGFGKNTGLGLFLVREILSLTNITIRETGIPGTGARFEIIVPKGSYRRTGTQ
ncbi:MAG TPA: ATP-binding protein [Methanoregula sp.]|nr:ATP-binding protein [Methanoregula sp.]